MKLKNNLIESEVHLSDKLPSDEKEIQAHFLIIGSGRLAKHLRHYFSLLNLKVSDWDRSQDPHLINTLTENATHILLAVSDNAIESVYNKYFNGHQKKVIHFSGALHLPNLISAHPLMTFGHELYEDSIYSKMHFVITGASALIEALPGVPNSFSIVNEQQKSFYHALCVIGGNFPTLLIKKMLDEFIMMQIPPEAAKLYVEKIVDNVFSNPALALTGPIARKDEITVQKNLKSLEEDPYQIIYKNFVDIYWPEYSKRGSK